MAALNNSRIAGMRVAATDLGKTSLFSAKDAKIQQGSQLMFTNDRVRITLFVYDQGRDLFVRWIGHCDMSGRRLWLLIGYVLSALDKLLFRWTGSSYLADGSYLRSILTPTSRFQTNLDKEHQSGFARLFGLIEILPYRVWNDLYALEGALRTSTRDAVRLALVGKGREEEIERLFSQQLANERGLQRSASSSTAAAAAAARR